MTHEQGPSVTYRTTSRSDRRRRRLQQVSGYLVVLLALSVMGVVFTLFTAESNAQTDEGTNQSLAVREGRDLYLQGCSTCHGLDLQGGAGGPSLIGVGQASVVYQVESGRMPLQQGIQQAPRKLPKYTLEEVDQLAAFIQANGGGPEIPASGLADGDLSLGGELFRTNCSSCHNHAGSGGALTYGKYAPELAPSSERVIWGAMLSGPGNMPRFSDQQLTPDEKRAITRYITYLQDELPNPGGAGLGRYGPVPEGLVSWVVGITAMVILTLWIGARA
jgi:ubiquinol-cytochrome c reductase cytochrome c subunit